jgi:hypothetical protein
MYVNVFFRLSPGGEDPHLIFIQVFLPKMYITCFVYVNVKIQCTLLVLFGYHEN